MLPHGRPLGTGVVVFVGDARVKLIPVRTELDPSNVLLRIRRRASSVRRRHAPIPEVQGIGGGDDQQSDGGMKGDGGNDGRWLHSPGFAAALDGRWGNCLGARRRRR